MEPRAPVTFCDYWCSQTKQPTRTRSTESPLALDLHIDRPLLALFKVDDRRSKTMFFFKRMYTPACRQAAWCSEPWPLSCSGCRPSTSTLEGAGRVPGARGWSARPPQQPEHPPFVRAVHDESGRVIPMKQQQQQAVAAQEVPAVTGLGVKCSTILVGPIEYSRVVW